jgi:MFS family permease
MDTSIYYRLTDEPNNRVTFYGYFVVTIGALYLFLDTLLAVFPAALTNQFMVKYHLAATGVSFFAALYFYIYAPLQMPVGSVLDKFGPTRIMIFGCLLCTVGLLMLAYTASFFIGCLARLLMGIGASAGYLAPMLLIVRWFPHRYYVMVTGIIVFVECLGAIYGGTFLSYLTNYYGIQTIITNIAILGLILLVLIIFFVRDQPKSKSENIIKNTAVKFSIIPFKEIFLSAQNWLIAITAALFWTPVSVFAILWGIPYLQIVYHVPKTEAGNLLIMIWLGIGIIYPLWGWISNYLSSRIAPVQIAAVIGLFASCILIFDQRATLYLLAFVLFTIGSASACQALTFGFIKDRYPQGNTATAFGFNNMIICFGTAITQIIAGYLLDMLWDGKYLGTLKIYSSQDFRHSLIIIPLCYLIILIISKFFLKETYKAA